MNRNDAFGLQDERLSDQMQKKKEGGNDENGKKVIRDFKYTPTGSHIPIHIRYTESGNWNDKKIANHYDPNLQSRTGLGGTTRAAGNSTQSGRDVDIDLNVNWWVDSRHANTDAVARELQHVRDFHTFSNAFANRLSSDGPLPSLTGFRQTVRDFYRDNQLKYDPVLKADMPHNLSPLYYPPRPFMLPTFENTANEAGH